MRRGHLPAAAIGVPASLGYKFSNPKPELELSEPISKIHELERSNLYFRYDFEKYEFILCNSGIQLSIPKFSELLKSINSPILNNQTQAAQ